MQCHCCIVVAQELEAAVQGSSFVWTEVETGVRGLQDIRRVPSAFQGRGIRDEGPMFVTYFEAVPLLQSRDAGFQRAARENVID